MKNRGSFWTILIVVVYVIEICMVSFGRKTYALNQLTPTVRTAFASGSLTVFLLFDVLLVILVLVLLRKRPSIYPKIVASLAVIAVNVIVYFVLLYLLA